MRELINIIESIIVTEGGNIWKDDLATVRINKNDVVPTVKFLEKITGLPLVDNMLGSTGIKASSGDLDLAVDNKKIDKAELQKRLDDWSNKNDNKAFTKKTGVSVHFRTPINGDPNNGYVQTDFMFLDDLPFAKWSMSAPESQFRGAHKHILLASVAKALGLKWSFQTGLSDRATGKTLEKGKDPNFVAKQLFGPKANADTIKTVETMLAALENDPDRQNKLADARTVIGKELDQYEQSKNLTEENKQVSKNDIESVLRKNGFENFKVSGNKLQVLVQIPDGSKKEVFRKATLQNILQILKKSFPKSGVQYSNDATLSSIGGVVFSDSPVKVLVKDLGKQGDKSAGVANEIELAGIISSMIEKYGSANVKFIDERNKVLALDDVTEVEVAGRDTGGRKKADVVLKSETDRLPISIKKVNADMWESADNLFGARAKSILEKLVKEKVVKLTKIKERNGIPVYALSKEIVMEPTEEEAMQAIFGSDINPKGGIVIQTFTPEHFQQKDNNITINCKAVIASKDDIPESHVMYWLLRNDSDRNSKSLGIAGIRPLGVTMQRGFGKSGSKDVIYVNVDGEVTDKPTGKTVDVDTRKKPDLAKAAKQIDRGVGKPISMAPKKSAQGVGRQKRK
jgi:hypothetical protein